VNELLYRRVDIEDVVATGGHGRGADAGLRQVHHHGDPPFDRNDLADLGRDAPAVLERRYPVSGYLPAPLAHAPTWIVSA
jgi:hypothetical protein